MVKMSASRRARTAERDPESEIKEHKDGKKRFQCSSGERHAGHFNAEFDIKYIKSDKISQNRTRQYIKNLFVAPVGVLSEEGKSDGKGLYLQLPDDTELTEIPKGTLLIEYTGKKLTEEKLKELHKQGESGYGRYILTMDDEDENTHTHIDAKTEGNEARFANTGEEPNCIFHFDTIRKKFYIQVDTPIPLSRDKAGRIKPVQIIVHYPFPSSHLKIALQAHHSDKTYQEIYDENKEDYIDLEKVKDDKLKEDIRTLLKIEEKDSPQSIYIPTFMADESKLTEFNVNDCIFVGEKRGKKFIPHPKQLELNAFMLACYKLDLERIKELTAHGADLRYAMDFSTLLHFVLKSSHTLKREEVFKYLLRKELATPLVENNDQETIYHLLAQKKEYLPLLKILCDEFHFHLTDFLKSPIRTAIQSKNWEAVKLLIEANIPEIICSRLDDPKSKEAALERKKNDLNMLMEEHIYPEIENLDETEWKDIATKVFLGITGRKLISHANTLRDDILEKLKRVNKKKEEKEGKEEKEEKREVRLSTKGRSYSHTRHALMRRSSAHTHSDSSSDNTIGEEKKSASVPISVPKRKRTEEEKSVQPRKKPKEKIKHHHEISHSESTDPFALSSSSALILTTPAILPTTATSSNSGSMNPAAAPPFSLSYDATGKKPALSFKILSLESVHAITRAFIEYDYITGRPIPIDKQNRDIPFSLDGTTSRESHEMKVVIDRGCGENFEIQKKYTLQCIPFMKFRFYPLPHKEDTTTYGILKKYFSNLYHRKTVKFNEKRIKACQYNFVNHTNLLCAFEIVTIMRRMTPTPVRVRPDSQQSLLCSPSLFFSSSSSSSTSPKERLRLEILTAEYANTLMSTIITASKKMRIDILEIVPVWIPIEKIVTPTIEIGHLRVTYYRGKPINKEHTKREDTIIYINNLSFECPMYIEGISISFWQFHPIPKPIENKKLLEAFKEKCLSMISQDKFEKWYRTQLKTALDDNMRYNMRWVYEIVRFMHYVNPALCEVRTAVQRPPLSEVKAKNGRAIELSPAPSTSFFSPLPTPTLPSPPPILGSDSDKTAFSSLNVFETAFR